MADKFNFHARVTPRSHRAWRRFAAAHGVSVTGIVEAIGERFDAFDGGEASAAAKRLVRRAREIDGENRRRGTRD